MRKLSFLFFIILTFAITTVKAQQDQTINFSTLSNRVYGGDPFELTATSVSTVNGTATGLPITYSSSNTSVATVSGNVITVVGVGSTVITANQPGGSGYNAATPVNRGLTVTKSSFYTISIPLAPRTFGVAPFTISASALGVPELTNFTYESLTPSVVTISGNTVTVVGAGTASIQVTCLGSANYTQQIITKDLIINKATQTITFATPAAKVVGDPNFALGATVSTGLTLAYLSSNTSVATVDASGTVTVTSLIANAGTTDITVTQAGNSNYSTTSVTRTLIVNATGKTNQTVTFGALAAKTYDTDGSFGLAASASSGLAVTYTSSNTNVATISGSTVIITGAGSTDITASQAGNGTFNPASTTQTLIVNKGSQTITFGGLANKTYGNSPFGISASTDAITQSPALQISYSSSDPSVATVDGNQVTIVGAGTTTITASQGGNNNYNAATSVDRPLTIVKANQTVTFNALPVKTMGDAPFVLAATASTNLPITYTSSNTSVATVSGNIVTIVGIGSATITATQAGNTNYNSASVDQTLTVNDPSGKSVQTIIFNDNLTGKTLGDAPFNLTATVSSGESVTYTSSDVSVATISGNTVTIVGVGTTTITASHAGNASYHPVSATKELKVTGTQTIQFSNINKTYGDPDFILAATVVNVLAQSTGLPITYVSNNPTVASINGNIVTIRQAGSATITARQTTGSAYYSAAADVPITLTISKAAQTITFNTLPTKTEGDADFEITVSTSSGDAATIVSSDVNVATIDPTGINTFTVHIVGAGTTTFTASLGSSTNFNAATDVPRTLTVNPTGSAKQNQTITFGALSAKTFGGSAFSLTAVSNIQSTSTPTGLVISYASSNTSVATVSGNTVTIVGVGTADITASQVGDASYNPATPVVRTLTVNKGTQSITFNTITSKVYGSAPFDVVASANTGLPLTFSSSNTSVATISGTTVTIVGAGSATITASQVGNANYNPASSIRSLTVTKASNAITFVTLPSKAVGDAPFDLTATASSGLAVSYVSSNVSVATVSGSTVTIVGAGTTQITASQSGDANYNAATSISRQLNVSATANKQNQTITFANLTSKAYKDAPFDLTATASSGLTVTYTSSNTSVATISGSTVTVIGVGITNITASQAGDATYNAAPSVTKSLSVIKATQTITFDQLPEKAVGNAPFDLTATASSGLAVVYTSSNTSVATISGSKVTIVGEGTTNITAAQAGDANYASATPVIRALVVKLTTVTAVIDNEAPVLSAYPNPCTDIVFIQTASKFSKIVAIFNSSGALVERIETTNQNVEVQTSQYTGGLYFVKISDKDNSATLKFIKR